MVLLAKLKPLLFSISTNFWSLSFCGLSLMTLAISSISCWGVTLLVLDTEADNRDRIDTAPLGVWMYFDRRILEMVDGLSFSSLANSKLLRGLSCKDCPSKNSACIRQINSPTSLTVSFLFFTDLISHCTRPGRNASRFLLEAHWSTHLFSRFLCAGGLVLLGTSGAAHPRFTSGVESAPASGYLAALTSQETRYTLITLTSRLCVDLSMRWCARPCCRGYLTASGRSWLVAPQFIGYTLKFQTRIGASSSLWSRFGALLESEVSRTLSFFSWVRPSGGRLGLYRRRHFHISPEVAFHVGMTARGRP